MALIGNIILSNGVTCSYHRIVSLHNITNQTNIIEVASYINKDQRIEEKYKLLNNEFINIFIYTTYYSKAYTKDFNINISYDYLKTFKIFNKCLDDI